MNKKQLIALVEGMVAKVAEQNSITEDQARTLVGLTLQTNGDKLIAGIMLPVFERFEQPTHAE